MYNILLNNKINYYNLEILHALIFFNINLVISSLFLFLFLFPFPSFVFVSVFHLPVHFQTYSAFHFVDHLPNLNVVMTKRFHLVHYHLHLLELKIGMQVWGFFGGIIKMFLDVCLFFFEFVESDFAISAGENAVDIWAEESSV
jgi:hypothetical protein